MPYSTELGMRVYDPSEGYNRGLQLGQFASRGMQSAMDERRTRMAEEEAALRRQMHMERAVALEAMNKEIRESMAADPKLTDEEARIKIFPKYAGDILGENVGNYYAQLPYRQAQIEYAKARQAEASKPSFQPRLVQVTDEQGNPVMGDDGKPLSMIQSGPNQFIRPSAASTTSELAKTRESRMAYASAMKDKRVVDLLDKRKPIADEYIKQKAAGPWMWPIEGKEKHEAQLKRLEEALKEIDDQIVDVQKKYGVQINDTAPAESPNYEPETATGPQPIIISEPTPTRKRWDPVAGDFAK